MLLYIMMTCTQLVYMNGSNAFRSLSLNKTLGPLIMMTMQDL